MVGKTYGACMELGAHITGLYSPDWVGKKLEFDRPAVFWVIGISQDSVNNVLMKELLGVSDCRNLSELGTGSIPAECINSFSLVKDGARCIQVRIKHVNGYENTLMFYSATQDQAVFMGQSVDYVLIDEQSDAETLIYAQALTRTLTTDGMISVTATPERGMSPLWIKFNEDDSGELYFQNTTWDQCPHITPERRKRILAGYPTYQHRMRSEGVPILEAGAIYPYDETEIDGSITVEHILDNAYAYKLLWCCDFGYSSNAEADPSVLMLLAYHQETDTIYTVSEWNSKQDCFTNRNAHLPEHMASIIKASRFPYAPLLVPHDGKRQVEGTNTTRLSEFKRLGINVLPRVFEIPTALRTGVFDAPKHPRSLHWTIQYLNKLFSEGKLKLDTKKLKGLMKEFRLYHWKSNGEPVDKNNHHLDALRYGATSIKHKGWLASRCLGKGKSNYEEAHELNEKLRARQF
ncbi:hypothetical protein EM825_00050 [Salmonella enterica subsp. enterica serovar Redlands]|nr:hypothetical protein [Salmonella enterica subsp. enterica serovar Redlands]